MRIGTSLPDQTGPDALTALRDQLQQAADAGFASAWISNIFGLHALTALAVAGRQVPGIEVGTAVVPTYPRHPAALAQQALTAETMRAKIGLTIPRPDRARSRRLPVLLAAMAPVMLRLAGERADGTVLWMTGPATVRDHIVPAITQAARAAGRPAPRVVCILPVCVTDDPDLARARAARVFAIYGQLPSYRAMLDREGAAGPADVAIIGDEDTVGSKITALADAGVTDFVAGEFAQGDDAKRTRDLLKSLIR